MKLFHGKEEAPFQKNEMGFTQAIEVKNIIGNQAHHEQSSHCIIVVTLKGSLKYTFDVENSGEIKERQMLLLPPNRAFKLKANGWSQVILIRLKFCESYSIEQLTHATEDLLWIREELTKQTIYLLNVNEGIENYLSGLLTCLKKHCCCPSFFDLKIKELFYLLRLFYSKEELTLFCKDVLNADTYFSCFVICNHKRFNTVAQFSAAANMTPWSFEKQFKMVFNMPAYQWMKGRKAKDIYRAICSEPTPLKELAIRFGFSSKSSFSEFCKKNLGNTPGRLRRDVAPDGNKKQNQ